MKHIAYIGLGANLGNPQVTLRAAALALAAFPGTSVSACSSHSAPIDADGDDYVNAVVQLETILTPIELLGALQALEQQFGRERSYLNAPRTLDLDLLLYDEQILNTVTLQIPHPRMSQRAFVILPLLELNDSIAIPNIGLASTLVKTLQNQRISKITQ